MSLPHQVSAVAPLLNDQVYLNSLRQQMLKFAKLQLNDEHLAEDAVQDALMGACKNAQSFSGRAAFKSWVFAILKNKIADVLRKKGREIDASSVLSREGEDDDYQNFFDSHGHWLQEKRPQAWDNLDQSLEQQQFWQVFEACLEHLPAQHARIFMMREFIELEADEICQAAEVSISNLHVTLHRARLKLRGCLDKCWFQGGEAC